ncbi:MAG: diguanylate cyclase, partial [Mangrovicoccus sp.]|nr:diguanylate cyclase [Mangrovicoccus sp.]
AQQLALAEAPRRFDPTGQVVLAGASAQQTEHWAEQLRQHLPALIHPTTVQAALSGMRAGNAPDVFAITCGTDHRDPGIQLISELRSRRESHHAALIAVITPPEAIRCARRDRAAMALDIGAADVMVAGFEPQELALRMIRQLAHKKQADFRRQTLRNGLEMAITDPLTGLYNRRYALPQLARISTAAWAQNTPFATMVLDIDRFKSINDNFGHAAGDQVLMNIAARLKKNLRANDLLARIGGEEFLIAMPGSGENAAGEAAERLRDVIRLHPVCLPDVTQKISLTCSIGVFVTDPRRIPAPKPPAPPPVAELIQEADKALYLSKSKGRDMVSFARPAA